MSEVRKIDLRGWRWKKEFDPKLLAKSGKRLYFESADDKMPVDQFFVDLSSLAGLACSLTDCKPDGYVLKAEEIKLKDLIEEIRLDRQKGNIR